MHTSPELERAIAHLQQGYGRLPLALCQTLIEQGFDPESLVARFA
jgi:hypothetical protein